MRGMTKPGLPARSILIVEDDQLLKLLTIDIVEEAGFVALSASNADEAMVILAARSDIAMLLTDINMPGSMDGLELSHVVHTRWPLIKIVVVSARNDVSAKDIPAEGRFFRKPYHADVMISAIRSSIGPGGRPAGNCVYLDV